MFKVSAGQKEFNIDIPNIELKEGILNGTAFQCEIQKDGTRLYDVQYKGKSFKMILEYYDAGEKTVTLRINGIKHVYSVKDKNDELLNKLGLVGFGARKSTELKSPMPGLVLRIEAKVGVPVKKGDILIVLEAMKMENVLKASADFVVKAIKCQTGQAVEKNQVLIQFE